MLTIPQKLHEQIKAHGEASYPFEGCGLLLGTAGAAENVVQLVRPLPNVWPNEAEKPVRFSIDPAAWRDVELEAMSNDLDVVGIFHSHPNCPPVASPRDLAWASWPGYSYLITRVEQGQAQNSQSWQLAADRTHFVEEAIQEVESSK